jgi:hypothetical protein
VAGTSKKKLIERDQAIPTLLPSYTGGEPMEPSRNAREASLLQAFRLLPPDAAAELTALAERLAALRAGIKIDWSDSWSDEDLKDFTVASTRRLEAEDPEERH